MTAFKKTLAERLFKISKISNQSLTNCHISSPSVQTRRPKNPSQANMAPDPGDKGVFRRLFHKRAVFQPSASGDFRPTQIGGNPVEKLKALDFARDRIRLDGLCPPPILKVERSPADRPPEKEGLTVKDARKLLLVAQLETVKSRLRGIEKSWVTYTEFVQICGEICWDPEQAVPIAKTLDESGTVIVLGNVVYLKPEQENVETLLFRQI
uniref:Uncharacterized protein n=1 Tax=Rhizophora mucronata TaxID=61149 RepID=A0A2P2K9F1_RHIMU